MAGVFKPQIRRCPVKLLEKEEDEVGGVAMGTVLVKKERKKGTAGGYSLFLGRKTCWTDSEAAALGKIHFLGERFHRTILSLQWERLRQKMLPSHILSFDSNAANGPFN
jgi:hypothetical protein